MCIRDRPTPGLTYPPPSLLRFPPQGLSVRPEGQPLSTPTLVWTCTWRYRNINLLCIDYASRPRLSSRLTLGGLALSLIHISTPRGPISRTGRRHSRDDASPTVAPRSPAARMIRARRTRCWKRLTRKGDQCVTSRFFSCARRQATCSSTRRRCPLARRRINW